MKEGLFIGRAEKGPEAFRKFKELLRGWRTSPDGEDFCPDCWQKFLHTFKEKHRKDIEEDSRPTSQYAETRRASDAWFTMCKECNKDIAVRYPETQHG